jgi:hypothetical protein
MLLNFLVNDNLLMHQSQAEVAHGTYEPLISQAVVEEETRMVNLDNEVAEETRMDVVVGDEVNVGAEVAVITAAEARPHRYRMPTCRQKNGRILPQNNKQN